MVLKEAPTKTEGKADRLSFRDVMDLAYLEDRRLAGGQLLNEQHFMKNLKLRQLVEVVFGVHDQALAALGDRILRLDQERLAQHREIESLRGFLEEQRVRPRNELELERVRLSGRRRSLRESLREAERQMATATQDAEAARGRFAERRAETSKLRAQLMDRKSLVTRLLPLRGQYAEDQRKLVFFEEARRVFDPLSVVTCPACLSTLRRAPEIVDGTCSLCRHELAHLSVDTVVDTDAERRAIQRRITQVDAYIAEVEEQIVGLEAAIEAARDAEAAAAAALNDDVAERLAPFVADRDRIIERREVTVRELKDLDRELAAHDAIERRVGEMARLEDRIAQLRAEQRTLDDGRLDRTIVMRELTARFHHLLQGFGFPKLLDPEPPRIDPKDLQPHVRGRPYAKLRSRGAITLVAVAWQLTMFEEAYERGLPHPGFLLIDSPQSGLKPASDDDEETLTPEIAALMWAHIRNWSATHPGAQLIIVDNLPPSRTDPHVVVRYSGRADQPPYGFIENEAGEPSA